MKIRNYSDITNAWLDNLLFSMKDSDGDKVGEIRILNVREELVSVIARLEISFAPSGKRKNLFLKVSKNGRHDAYANREVNFYTKLCHSLQSSSLVGCFAGEYYKDCGNSFLLLDDLTDSHYTLRHETPPSTGELTAIVRSLANVHSHWWGYSDLASLTGATEYREFVETDIQWALDHFPRFLDVMKDRLTFSQRSLYDLILERAAELERIRLRLEPITFLHGDCHVWNFLLPRTEKSDSVKLIDWESYEVGPAVTDLSYMIALFFPSDESETREHSLVQEYHRALIERGVQGYSWLNCWQDYRISAIRNLWVPVMQWQFGRPETLWLGHIERACRAFKTLHCEDFL